MQPKMECIRILIEHKLREHFKRHGFEDIVIEPLQLGPGSAHVLRSVWPGLPIVGIGPGNHGSNHHGSNENLRVEDYKNSVKQCIALLYTYGNAGEGTLC